MNTSPTSFLAKPANEEKISERALGYVTEMAREEVFDMIANACIESGVTRATIARRLGKDPAQITRLLNAPGNWTIDTIAELLFAIDGAMLRVSHYCPDLEPKANDRFSICLDNVPSSSLSPVSVQFRAPTPILHLKTGTGKSSTVAQQAGLQWAK